MVIAVTAAEARARSVAICLARADDWRRQAGHLRDHAAQPHVAPDVSAVLLREAAAAEQMAALWLAGAEGAQR